MSTATLSEDGKFHLLNGNKQFITNAGFADIVFTYAKIEPNGKRPDRATIPVRMTKVLFHDSLGKIEFLARGLLEKMETGELLVRHLSTIRKLMVSPPMDAVILRREIANWMIQSGDYAL